MFRLLLILSVVLCGLVSSSLACGGPGGPCVTTLDAMEITANSADLWGYLDQESAAAVRFEVWTVGYREVFSAGTMTGPDSFKLRVNDLEPETTYYFKAGAERSGAEAWGDEKPFKTLAQVQSPVLTTGDATDITSESAILHGTVESVGMASNLAVQFQVRTSSGGLTIYPLGEIFQSPGPFSLEVSGLTPDTTHYWRAAGTSINLLVPDGEEKSFKTTKGAELTILSSQMVTEGPTVLKVTGQAQNTGTKVLTHAQIGVNFKDASGAVVGSAIADKDNLGLGEVWTWEATYPSTDISNVASYEAYVAYVLWT